MVTDNGPNYPGQMEQLGESTDAMAERAAITGLVLAEEARISQIASPFRGYVRTPDTVLFRRALHASGPQAVAAIFDLVRDGHIDAFDTGDYIELCATPKNADQILDFMIAFKSDGGEIHPLNDTMQRLAVASHIPKLREFCTPPVEPQGMVTTTSTRIAASIALAAQQRETDAEAQQSWQDFIDELTERRSRRGELILDADEIERMRMSGAPARLALQVARQFNTWSSDPTVPATISTAAPRALPRRLESSYNLYALAEGHGDTHRGDRVAAHILDRLCQREASPSPYGVDLGFEAEVEYESLITPFDPAHETVADRIDALLDMLTRYHQVVATGMPSPYEEDPTVIREFSPKPAAHYETLMRELQLLMAMNVIDPSYAGHPFHVTVGNVTSKGPKGDATATLIYSLAATGWSASAARVMQPKGKPGSWAFKSKGGLKERSSNEILGPARTAVEARIFCIRSLGGAARTLRSLQGLGAAVRAYQTETPHDTYQTALATIWSDYSRATTTLFEEAGFSNDPDGWDAHQKERSNDAHLGSNFLRLAELISQAEAGPDSEGGRFQAAMQHLIVVSRGEALRILQQSQAENLFH
jgi:hypothetical protein